jgi:hypothetical protein
MKNSFTKSALFALLPVVLVGLGALPSPAQKAKPVRDTTPRPRVDMTPPIAEDSPLMPAFRASRGGDDAQTAILLKAVRAEKLPPEELRRWRILAKRTALRVGDAALLNAANAFPDRYNFPSGRLILDAMEYLQNGDLALCKETLKQVKDAEYLDERSRRRYLAMGARLAQMEGDTRTERIYLAKLVDYAGNWATPVCQSCHTNPEKHGDQVTTLDMTNWWVGKRFAQVLREQGDAEAVWRAAEKRLAADKEDEAAVLRIAYAKRALNDEAATEKTLRTLFWTEFPDREKLTPIDLLTFP